MCAIRTSCPQLAGVAVNLDYCLLFFHLYFSVVAEYLQAVRAKVSEVVRISHSILCMH